MTLTVEQFKKCFPTAADPEEWTAALNTYLPKYGMDSLVQTLHFLAQAGHESQGFTVLVENLNYSAIGLANTWPHRYSAGVENGKQVPNELARMLQRNPEAIANNCYANRLGNGPESSGDGWLCRGRGLLQLTGRDLITAYAKHAGLTFAEAVVKLKTIPGAVEGSCYFWAIYKRVIPTAETGRVKDITRKVNGGLIGLAERYQLTEHISAVLQAA